VIFVLTDRQEVEKQELFFDRDNYGFLRLLKEVAFFYVFNINGERSILTIPIDYRPFIY
jgi:hypothetical protein